MNNLVVFEKSELGLLSENGIDWTNDKNPTELNTEESQIPEQGNLLPEMLEPSSKAAARHRRYRRRNRLGLNQQNETLSIEPNHLASRPIHSRISSQQINLSISSQLSPPIHSNITNLFDETNQQILVSKKRRKEFETGPQNKCSKTSFVKECFESIKLASELTELNKPSSNLLYELIKQEGQQPFVKGCFQSTRSASDECFESMNPITLSYQPINLSITSQLFQPSTFRQPNLTESATNLHFESTTPIKTNRKSTQRQLNNDFQFEYDQLNNHPSNLSLTSQSTQTIHSSIESQSTQTVYSSIPSQSTQNSINNDIQSGYDRLRNLIPGFNFEINSWILKRTGDLIEELLKKE